MNLVWVSTLGIRNAFHLQRLRVTKIKLGARSSIWHFDSKKLKITSIDSVNRKLWSFEWSIVHGQCSKLEVLSYETTLRRG